MTQWQVITRMAHNAQMNEFEGLSFFFCFWMSYVRLQQASKAVTV